MRCATQANCFAYDAAGNMTLRQLAGQPAQTLTWDAEGELAQVAADGNGDGDTTDAGEKDGYVYTADGDRVVRIQDGIVTAYLPGGIELSGPAAGQPGATSAVRYYEFAGQTVAVRTGSGSRGTTTLVADHHGTAQLPVNQDDNTVTRRYTDPYGATRGAVAGDADADGRLDGGTRWAGDHGFLDKPVDATGLTGVGARMYDAVLGRFISVDPVMNLTDPQQWNAYSYSNNNPVTWSDPTGELPMPMIDGMYGSPKAAGYAKTQTRKGKAIAQAGAVEPLAMPGVRTNKNTRKAPTRRAGNAHPPAPLLNPPPRLRLAQEPTFQQTLQTPVPSQGSTPSSDSPTLREWTHRNFLTAQGVESWTDKGATITGYISRVGLAIRGVGASVAAFTCAPTVGAGCAVGGTIAGVGATISTGFAARSTLHSFANASAKYRLGVGVKTQSHPLSQVGSESLHLAQASVERKSHVTLARNRCHILSNSSQARVGGQLVMPQQVSKTGPKLNAMVPI